MRLLSASEKWSASETSCKAIVPRRCWLSSLWDSTAERLASPGTADMAFSFKFGWTSNHYQSYHTEEHYADRGRKKQREASNKYNGSPTRHLGAPGPGKRGEPVKSPRGPPDG